MAAGQQQYSLSGNAAEVYERNMVPAMFLPFARDLLERAALRPGEAMLDVACGKGIVARLAWPMVAPGGRVVGVDFNPAMLEVASKIDKVPVERVAGDATALKSADREFDVILCQHGLQFFPDRKAALGEMRRVLRPGGRLFANVWRSIEHNAGHHVLAEVLERRVGKEAAATRRAPFKLSRRDEIRTLMEGAGFGGVAVEIATRVARFPSAEGMIRMMMAGTPLAAEMAKPSRRWLAP
jgi:SAM-dependent methyltransferase